MTIYITFTHLLIAEVEPRAMILVTHGRGFLVKFIQATSCMLLILILSFIPQPPQDLLSEESDTASVTSSIASPKMERKFKKTKYNVQPRIDTNLTPKRKEKVAKSSAVATPRLRLTTPVPYNASRSRDPSPARGASRSREPSFAGSDRQ